MADTPSEHSGIRDYTISQPPSSEKVLLYAAQTINSALANGEPVDMEVWAIPTGEDIPREPEETVVKLGIVALRLVNDGSWIIQGRLIDGRGSVRIDTDPDPSKPASLAVNRHVISEQQPTGSEEQSELLYFRPRDARHPHVQ